ncbi:MAG: hypothetical protein KH045_04745 [Megamonas funiformis]|jgi:hypothetical protein|uniref:hypothetical protein n=1 Tax=Megamonas funiformis TaxID=437897 RepID=UPI0018757E50|nr:hypothetical protein [Megamonas funiformis]MBE5061033.1 hypothetical protein [Megamonas funiformis]MBS7211861.1 hypothetical protein [Megamonas funiformis]
MYTNLILYRNELKNKNIAKYKVIGIVAELLLSKKIFNKNVDIEKFLEETFNLYFKTYLYKSRTLLVARVIREIIKLENNSSYKKRLFLFIDKKIEELKNEAPKNSKNDFDGWLS